MTTEKDDSTDVYPVIEPAEDKVYRLAEVVTSLIPTGQAMLHALIAPPIKKRMEYI